MYSILLDIHSILRWVLLLVMAVSILKSFPGWFRNLPFGQVDDKFSLLTLIFAHTQLILGLILYFISPIVQQGLGDMGGAMKDADVRFWTVEHITGMIAAIALVTVGRISSKKKTTPRGKHKTVAIYFTIALILMIVMIPWERF